MSKGQLAASSKTFGSLHFDSLPSEWKIYPLGSLGEIVTGKTPSTSQQSYFGGDIPFVSPTDIGEQRYISQTQSTLTAKGAEQVRLLPANTLLITCIGILGKVGQAATSLATNQQINGILPSDRLYHAYGFWAAHLLKPQLDIIAGLQVVPIVNKTLFSKLLFPCPPFSEQHLIADILDTLDTQIQQTERLIAKLKRIKIGLLHDLLTKGIDEHGDVRDPMVHPEEFKEGYFLQKRIKLPQKWEIRPLKSFLVGIDAGKSPDCPDQPAGAGDWGILKVSAIHPTGFRAEENKVIINPAYINPAYEVHDGDLLISRANTSELVGIVCLVSKPRPQLLLCDKTLRLQVNTKNALSKFIFYMLQMPFVRAQIEMHATGSSASMKNISQNSIKNLAILAPSKEEQKEIISILNAHDARITAEETELAKLKQLKKGLMHDLLTGHVRVTQLMAESEQLAVCSKSVSDCK